MANLKSILNSIGRWVVALLTLVILVPAVSWCAWWLYDWLVGISEGWSWFFHVAFLFLTGGTATGVIITIAGFIGGWCSLIVRRHLLFIAVAVVGFVGLSIWNIYGAWSDSITYDWEVSNYGTTNRFMFSLIMLCLMMVPALMLRPNMDD